MDFGAWWSYVYDRLAGFELREEHAKKGRAAWTFGSKERKEFAEFYAAEASAAQAATSAQQSGTSTARLYGLTCTAPVKFTGYAAIRRDIDNLAAAVASARVNDVFMTAVSPATTRIRMTIHGRSQKRSARNTKRSWTLALFCKLTIRLSSTSTTGGFH
jgi:5-methyltetrahydropteroyltriglutamate--homocysteine methyltransferase